MPRSIIWIIVQPEYNFMIKPSDFVLIVTDMLFEMIINTDPKFVGSSVLLTICSWKVKPAKAELDH